MSAATSLFAVARAAASGATVARLVLRGSPDLVCVNIMCDKVGEVCICRLSKALEGAPRVRELCLADNKLTALPASVFELAELESLDLSGNAFVELPEDLQRLRALVHLDVSGNPRLSALPTALASMPALRRVSLHGSRVDATAARRLLPEGIVIDADPR